MHPRALLGFAKAISSRFIEATKRELDLALTHGDKGANLLEEAGLGPQALAIDGAAQPIEELRDTLAAV